jgi:ClpP class serine protease
MPDFTSGLGAQFWTSVGQFLASPVGLAAALTGLVVIAAAAIWSAARGRPDDALPPAFPQFAASAPAAANPLLHEALDAGDGDDEASRRRAREREARAKRALGLIAKIENARHTRVVAIIHRENLESDYLGINDLEDVLAALQSTPEDKPLDIVLHTLGGWSLAATQIARAIKAHKGKTTAFIPYYAMSAGTFIALACDEIVMSPQACLGPIDPQLGLPAATFINVTRKKPPEATSDIFLAYADLSEKALRESKEEACELMQGTYSHNGSCAITDELSSGKWSHGRPISVSVARDMGLNIATDMPRDVYDLVRTHRVAYRGGPSVWFR